MLDTTRISAEDKKKYSKVIEAFDDHFKVQKNIIFKCTHFNKRSQNPGESVEHIITELYRLAENCDFRNMKDEIFQDCLVVEIHVNLLWEHLQMESELTLDKAKWLICQRETVREQQKVLKKPAKEDFSLHAIR